MTPPAPGDELAGRYRLERSLADDGLIERWAAVDHVLARPVEITAVSAASGTDARQAFVEAAAAAARLSHPSIVNAYDRGFTSDGLPFLVTERAVGPTLADLTARHGALSGARVATIGRQIAQALDTAHRAGTVHGEVGPHVVQVTEDDRAKLAGFTEAGTRARLSGASPAARDDVDACARMLAAALIGRAVERHGDPISPRALTVGVPPALDELLVSAQEGGPVGTASELADRLAALEPELADDARPLVDPRPTPPMTTRVVPPPPAPPSGRRGALAGVAVGLLLAAGVAIAAFVLFNQKGTSSIPGGTTAGTTSSTLAPKGAQYAVISAQVFDPFSAEPEHEQQAVNVFDGDPETVWSTEEYTTAHFGGLKPGVGIYVLLDSTHRLHQLEVDSPSRAWVFSVYVADRPPTTLSGWGQPVASGVTVTGPVTAVDLKETSGAAVMVWITDLGSPLPDPPLPAMPYRVDIGEIQVS